MLSNNVEIRPMEQRDVSAVMAIENSCFVAPWKESDLLTELVDNQFANLFVAELNNEIVGFVDYWHTFDSATICQIAVNKAFQRQHIGSLLLEEVKKDCYAKRVRIITLEVRKSNQNAIIFYKKHNFKEELIKSNYYSNGEDAIYMTYEVNINA